MTLHRPGQQPETWDHYYVVGTKPTGGLVLRVLMEHHIELEPNDTLIFDFTVEKT
jgi:hypothetical protein